MLFDRGWVFDCKLITIYEEICIVHYVLYSLFYTIYSVEMCSIDINNGLSLNSAAVKAQESQNCSKFQFY